MKQIKKYRGKIPKEERKKVYSQARLKAKHLLSKKYKQEYKELLEKVYKKLIRIYFKHKGDKNGFR